MEATSRDHLETANRLYNDNSPAAPVQALNEAIGLATATALVEISEALHRIAHEGLGVVTSPA